MRLHATPKQRVICLHSLYTFMDQSACICQERFFLWTIKSRGWSANLERIPSDVYALDTAKLLVTFTTACHMNVMGKVEIPERPQWKKQTRSTYNLFPMLRGTLEACIVNVSKTTRKWRVQTTGLPVSGYKLYTTWLPHQASQLLNLWWG